MSLFPEASGLVQAITLACRVFGIFPDMSLAPAFWMHLGFGGAGSEGLTGSGAEGVVLAGSTCCNAFRDRCEQQYSLISKVVNPIYATKDV